MSVLSIAPSPPAATRAPAPRLRAKRYAATPAARTAPGAVSVHRHYGNGLRRQPEHQSAVLARSLERKRHNCIRMLERVVRVHGSRGEYLPAGGTRAHALD